MHAAKLIVRVEWQGAVTPALVPVDQLGGVHVRSEYDAALM
jgi:hypothetical protein